MPDEPEASSGSGTDSLDGATGVFWFDGGPQKRGTLHLAKNGLKVITEGIARQPQSYSFSIGDGAASWALTHSGRPEDAVADNTAVPLLATLDDGRKITVRDARLAAEPPIGTQDILGTKILLGAHGSLFPKQSSGGASSADLHPWRLRWVTSPANCALAWMTAAGCS